MTEKKTKKIIIPQKRGEVGEVSVVPTLQGLMDDGLAIIGKELAQYRAKTARGATLDLKEARVVSQYLKAIVDLSKEDRERARSEDLANLTDEEIKQLATEVLNIDFSKGESE